MSEYGKIYGELPDTDLIIQTTNGQSTTLEENQKTLMENGEVVQ